MAERSRRNGHKRDQHDAAGSSANGATAAGANSSAANPGDATRDRQPTAHPPSTAPCGACGEPTASCACAREPAGTGDELVRQPHGGALRRGGAPGNMGGQPRWFRARLRELGSHPRTLGYIEACLEGQHGWQAAVAAWGHCLRYGLGDKTRVQFSGRLATLDMTRLNDEQLARIAGGEHPLAVLGSSLKELPGDVIDAELVEEDQDVPEDGG